MIRFRRKRFLSCLLAMSLTGGLTAAAAPSLTSALEVGGDKQVEDGTRISVQNEYTAVGISGAHHTTGTFTIGDGTGTLYINTESSSAGNSQSAGIMITDDSHVTVNGNVNVQTYSGSCFADGVYMMREGTGEGSKATIDINGTLTIGDPSLDPEPSDSNDEKEWGVNAKEIHGGYGPDGHVKGWADDYTGARWQPTGVDVDMSGGSTINLNGDVNLAVRGSALKTDPYYKSGTMNSYDLAVINANEGDITIITPSSTTESFYAAASYGGTININMNGNQAAGHRVNIKGNMIATKNDTSGSGQPYFYQDGRINLGLNTADSQWTGIVDNSGKSQAGELNLWLQNGAQWIHESPSKANGLQVEQMPQPSVFHYGTYDHVSHVNKLTGGSSEETAGIIHQNYASDIDISNYSGITKVIYEHTGSGGTSSNYKAGNIIIKHAQEGSGMILSTDSSHINMASETAVKRTLTALARKLYYTGYMNGERNLKAKVEIAEGLVSSSRTLEAGAVTFENEDTHEVNGEGQGSLSKNPAAPFDPVNPDQPDTPDTPDTPDVPIITGEKETEMMRQVRGAVTDAMLLWRDDALDSLVRLDMLRYRGGMEGAWGRIYGGRYAYQGKGLDMKDNMYALEAGYDRRYPNDWIAGVNVDYRKGDGKYSFGGDGDTKLYTLGLYATKGLGEKGFLDFSVKGGHVENDFTLYNSERRKLEGDYKTRGYSTSIRYGKRFGGSAGYIQPEIQLTWAHLDGYRLSADSGSQTMQVHIRDFESGVGRIGVQMGRYQGNNEFYLKTGLAHESLGKVKGTYSAEGEGTKDTSYDLKDTWGEITLGAACGLGPSSRIYVDVTRGISGDWKKEWSFNLGFRHEF